MSKMIQIRNVPDKLHKKLKARAAMEGLSLSDYLMRAAERAVEQPMLDELRARLLARTPAEVGQIPAEALRGERDGR
jgi:plasmid stability protein